MAVPPAAAGDSLTGGHVMVCSLQLMTETMTRAVVTVPCYLKVPAGTITVNTLTSMASTCVELLTVMVYFGLHLTILTTVIRSSGRK